MNNLEILSPVGDEKSFYCAINNGADAIYLGLKNFNARDKAQNFNTENLRDYVKFAHLHNVKVYVTINTILTDEELPQLVEMVDCATKSKVDAFIVQDLGVAKCLKENFKNIVLHASTQMGIHSVEGAKVAEKLGFTRIVLSRETSLEDIKEIKEKTNLEIEYFIQGALCVCFSGNCYYSSLNFNESGNRGRCLQPCRLQHTAKVEDVEVNKGYLLSTTDLCFINKLKQLIDLGVCSFKIEGRLRRPAYVAYMTKIYSEAKKLILKNEKFNTSEIVENIKKLFYRGEYNNGLYLQESNSSKIINQEFQNHRGVLIGSVIEVKPFKDICQLLIITNGYEIKQNDGLKFVYNQQEQSIGVGGVKKQVKNNHYLVYTKNKPKEQSEVYLTVDSAWENELENQTKKLKFSAIFEGKVGKKPLLKLKCGKVEISQVLFENLEKAKNQGLTYSDLKSCLEKTGDTNFVLKDLKANIENVFIARSQLNELRRLALKNLEEKVIEENEKNILKVERKINDDNAFNLAEIKENDKNIFVVLNENNFEEKLNELNKKNNEIKIVFSPVHFCLNNVENFIKKAKEKGFNKIFLDLPKVARKVDFDEIKNIVSSFNSQQIGLIANNISGLMFAENYEVIGGVYLNIANQFTVGCLKDLGIKTFVKSFENFASNFNLGLTYSGKPALMTFCHCPYKTTYKNKDCRECNFNDKLTYYSQNGKEYSIRRIKVKTCTFELISNERINDNVYLQQGSYNDLRQ